MCFYYWNRKIEVWIVEFFKSLSFISGCVQGIIRKGITFNKLQLFEFFFLPDALVFCFRCFDGLFYLRLVEIKVVIYFTFPYFGEKGRSAGGKRNYFTVGIPIIFQQSQEILCFITRISKWQRSSKRFCCLKWTCLFASNQNK